MQTALHNRCWNHEGREAVVRCPQCGRAFCRECVAEHEQRLLCANCLKTASGTSGQPSRNPVLARSLLALAGLVLAWFVLFSVGEAIRTYMGRLELTAWVRR